MLAEANTAISSARADVLAALKQASAATGSDFNYLLDTAMRESSLKPQAKSGTSSASGLFQFVDQTWLGLVKQHGAKYGLGNFAGAIQQGADGHYSVASPADRQAILALRNDPQTASLMEGEFARQTKSTLEQSLGRGVCNGELYAAHFLGTDAACRLIQMSASKPNANAAAAFPQAASANRSVFYHADGSAKTVGEVYQWATRQPGAAPVHVPSHVQASAAPSPAPSDDWTAFQFFAASGGNSFSSLPQTPFALTPDVMSVLASLNPLESDQSQFH